MDSKKKPLWLTCENHDDLGEQLIEMYKVCSVGYEEVYLARLAL